MRLRIAALAPALLTAGLILTQTLQAEPSAPPAPEALRPQRPVYTAEATGQWLSSQAFAGVVEGEALPECHPLPELHQHLQGGRRISRLWRIRPAAQPGDCGPMLSPAEEIVEKRQGHRVAAAGPSGVVVAAPGSPLRPWTARQPAAPQSPVDLTPIEHLRKAADHLDAAGHPDEAGLLRERADDLQRHARHRLRELREQQQQIEQEIERLERITVRTAQVQIRVSMLEVDEQKLKDLGITFSVPESGTLPAGIPHPLSGPGQGLSYELRPSDIAAAQLEVLKQSGAAKVLAEPVLVTPSGRAGTVVSGGEFPIPVPQQDGTVRMRFEECGVRLEAIPQVLDNGRLRLELAASMSERDDSNAVAVNGIRVPRVTTRRVNTQAVMSRGETLVIGGMTRRMDVDALVRQLPDWVGDLVQLAGGQVVAAAHEMSLMVFVTAEWE